MIVELFFLKPQTILPLPPPDHKKFHPSVVFIHQASECIADSVTIPGGCPYTEHVKFSSLVIMEGFGANPAV